MKLLLGLVAVPTIMLCATAGTIGIMKMIGAAVNGDELRDIFKTTEKASDYKGGIPREVSPEEEHKSDNSN